MEIKQQTRKSKGAYRSIVKSEKVSAIIRDGVEFANVFEWWSLDPKTGDDIYTRVYLTNTELSFLAKHLNRKN